MLSKKALLAALMIAGFAFPAFAIEDATGVWDNSTSPKSQNALNSAYSAEKYTKMPVRLNANRPRVGTVVQVPFGKLHDYDKYGWVRCDGRVLNKEEYRALYNLIGGTYGESSWMFAVPNYHAQALFLRGYSKKSSEAMGTVQEAMAKSPYTLNFWTMAYNPSATGSAHIIEQQGTEQIRLKKFTGIGSWFNDNDEITWGAKYRITYDGNKDPGEEKVHPVNYAVDYYIMGVGNDVGGEILEEPDPSTLEAYRQALQELQNLYDALAALQQQQNEAYRDAENATRDSAARSEAADANEYLEQAKKLQQKAASGKSDEVCHRFNGTYDYDNKGDHSCVNMPVDMANWMNARGLAWDKTGNDYFMSAGEWTSAVNNLTSYRNQKTAEYENNESVKKYKDLQTQIDNTKAAIAAQEAKVEQLKEQLKNEGRV